MGRMNRMRASRLLITGSMILFWISASEAQTTPAAPAPGTRTDGPVQLGAEDIVVTARRRAESLLNVPVAVTALSAAEVNRYAATDLTKIGLLIPQVMFVRSGGGGTGGALSIRGIGSSLGDAGLEQSVSINIDGVQINRGRAALQSFFDIAQVEVLKGPQALFFGKNSPAGVISIASQGPTDRLEAYARAGYEFNADERYVEGAVSAPLTNTLGIRIAGRASAMTGYIRNLSRPLANPFELAFPLPGADHVREPQARDLAGRLTVAWKPTPRFSATLKVFASGYRDNAETLQQIVCAPGVQPNTFGVPDPTGDCKLDGRRSVGGLPTGVLVGWPEAGDGQPRSRYRTQFGSLTLNYDLEGLTVTSVSGFHHYRHLGFFNVDFTSFGQGGALNTDRCTGRSQEIRLATKLDGPLNFVAGGFYESFSYFQRVDAKIAPLGPDPRNGSYLTWSRPAENHGETVSLFGQATWQIREDLELAGGARWSRDRKDVSMLHTYFNSLFPPGIFLPEGQIVAGASVFYNVSPEATLTWHPTPRSTIYAAYKTGYKAGGYSNPSALTVDYGNSDNARFGPERARGGEVGVKGSFLGNRLSVNATVYRYTFRGLQLSSFNAATTSFTIRNAATARTTGIEVDSKLTITDRLSLRSSAGYNRARYGNFRTAACFQGQTIAEGCLGTPDPTDPAVALSGLQDLSGHPLVRAPDVTGAIGASYEQPLSAGLTLSTSGDANYSSSYFTQENEDPLARQRSLVLLSASVRLHQAEDRWEIAFIGRNLTNRYYSVSSEDKPLGTAGQIAATIARPRELVLQGTVRF